jgi:hypothetical protein
MEIAMAVYWLSYRIEEDATGDERREKLVNEIQFDIATTRYWLETTSFIVFENSKRIDVLAHRFRDIIDQRVDGFLMRAMERRVAYICGNWSDQDIITLMVNPNGSTYLRQI